MKNFSINRPTEEDLKNLLEERIVIMDGAMGTMIQQEKLEEEDFRGDHFRDHAKELKGNKSLLKGMGYTGDLSGVTENNAVLGLIQQQKITNEKAADERSFNSLGRQDERRIRDERYADSRKDVANQMELTRAQMAQSDKRYLGDRIEAREARADDLMFRRESMERADRKDEKNRRRESIQALVAGLSSLGAAFAV